MDTHFPPQWRERVLSVLGASRTSENLLLLQAWAQAEGGTAQWNPLNTTYELPGATAYNDNGGNPVKNYKRPTEGVCATALTLANGHYPGILGSLQGGKATARQIVRAHWDEFKTWGTNPDVILSRLP